MMIWRVSTTGTTLDFGSQQAVLQFLDNYPPNIREQVTYKEISSEEIRTKIEDLKSQISRQRRDPSTREIIPSTHLEWLLSRLEFYDKALPIVELAERAVEERATARVGRYNSEVNEVFKGELQGL